jgi:hypothetical protein
VTRVRRRLPISVVVPTLNAAAGIDACLTSLRAQGQHGILVVDGGSTDGTLEIVKRHRINVVRHDGVGPASARALGAELSKQRWVAFVDADVVLPSGALLSLFEEAAERSLDAIAAGFVSISSGGYWSDQLARHHDASRSRHWFGLTTALIRHSVLRAVPFDGRLASGEDIDLRLRLQRAGVAVGTSERVIVIHHYARGWGTAVGQWTADGAGLGLLVRKDGLMSVPWTMLPVGAAVLGLLRSFRDGFNTIPYYVGHGVGNVIGLIAGIADRRVPLGPTGRQGVAAVLVMISLIGVFVVAVPLLIIREVIQGAPRLAQDAESSRMLPALTLAFVILLVLREIDGANEARRPAYVAVLSRILMVMGVLLGLGAILRMAAVVGLAS